MCNNFQLSTGKSGGRGGGRGGRGGRTRRGSWWRWEAGAAGEAEEVRMTTEVAVEVRAGDEEGMVTVVVAVESVLQSA